ncbi:MAG: biotin transporter BioY [Armatimonadota bacterium]
MHRAESLVSSLSIPITRRHALLAGGIAGAALATALAAHVRIPLPFSPVPVTLQTMVVLLSGAMLGAAGGTLSQVLYLALGIAGVATFAGGALTGVTGGYLLGFAAAAGIVGAVARRTESMVAVGAAMVAGEVAILGLGAAWLAHVGGLSAGQAVAVGLLPFVPGDAIKLAAALGLWKLGRVAWRGMIGAGGADD